MNFPSVNFTAAASKLAGLQINWWNLVSAALASLVGFVVSQNISELAQKALSKQMPEGMARSISRLVYYIFVSVLIVFVLSLLGVDVGILLTAGGVLGVAIGFASQKTVANLISGIFLYVDRPMDIGDSVDIGGEGGSVLDITPLSTRLRTWDGPTVRIPNSKVFESSITNYSKTVARRMQFTIGISYSDDPDKAIAIIEDVLDSEPFILDSPSPSVYVDELGDSAVNITVKAWAPTPKYWSVRHSVLQTLYRTLLAKGIKLPNPQLEVHLKK